MEDLKVAAVTMVSTEKKEENIAKIIKYVKEAKNQGVDIICFPEMNISKYTSNGEIVHKVAEKVPEGPSTEKLVALSRETGVTILAGIAELGEQEKVYDSVFAVNSDGYMGKYRKCHLNPGRERALYTPGESLHVFKHPKCTFGISICLDNNIPDTVQTLTLKGAEIIFMPHSTASMNPDSQKIAAEEGWFDNPNKYNEQLMNALIPSRNWIMTWLPSRAYDNGVFVVFVNQRYLNRILGPDGQLLAESNTYGEDMITAQLKKDYLNICRRNCVYPPSLRRPELHTILSEKREWHQDPQGSPSHLPDHTPNSKTKPWTGKSALDGIQNLPCFTD